MAALPEAVKLQRYEAEQARKERERMELIRNHKILAVVVAILAVIWIGG